MNAKHKQFADRYLKDPERNARRAYQKVYPKAKPSTADTNASMLLKNAEVAEYIKKHDIKSTEEVELTLEWLKKKFKDISDMNILDLFDTLPNNDKRATRTIIFKSIEDIPRQWGWCIESIQETKDGVRIKLLDKVAALTAIGRMLGGFIDKSQIEGEIIVKSVYEIETTQKEQQ